jgi:molecular chaperone Hsp33
MISTLPDDPLAGLDDFVAAFQLEETQVRGRIVRLGDGVLDPILQRHAYPRWAAHLLGEAILLAIMTSASLKIEGRVTVQAQGDGPVSLLVAEASSQGGVRGYLRHDPERWARMEKVNRGARPHAPQLFGSGVLAIILTPDSPDISGYQGLVPLEGATLSACAESYFNRSEQVPTRLRFAVAELSRPGAPTRWRAGGAMIQQVAGDASRGETSDEWETAQALFATLTDLELADPDLSSGRLLFRLFHEMGVRVEPPRLLDDRCTCSRERLFATLQGLGQSDAEDLADESGEISATCRFCAREYRFTPAELAPPQTGG